MDKEDAIQSIDAVITRVENLKRKVSEIMPQVLDTSVPSPQLSDLNENVGTPTQSVIRERLQHLSVVEDAQSQATPEYQRWSDTRLDRWLIDWTLRTGRERTAKKITAEKGIHVSHFVDRPRVR